MKFEYLTKQFTAELPALQDELNALGEDGWQLANIERIGGQDYKPNSGDLTPPIYQAIFLKAEMPEPMEMGGSPMDFGSLLSGLLGGGGLPEGMDFSEQFLEADDEEQIETIDDDDEGFLEVDGNYADGKEVIPFPNIIKKD